MRSLNVKQLNLHGTSQVQSFICSQGVLAPPCRGSSLWWNSVSLAWICQLICLSSNEHGPYYVARYYGPYGSEGMQVSSSISTVRHNSWKAPSRMQPWILPAWPGSVSSCSAVSKLKLGKTLNWSSSLTGLRATLSVLSKGTMFDGTTPAPYVGCLCYWFYGRYCYQVGKFKQ